MVLKFKGKINKIINDVNFRQTSQQPDLCHGRNQWIRPRADQSRDRQIPEQPGDRPRPLLLRQAPSLRKPASTGIDGRAGLRGPRRSSRHPLWSRPRFLCPLH